MSEIARTGKQNLGGGRRLELVPVALVSSYSRANLSSTPTITLKDGASWTKIYCALETLQYQVTCEPTDNGDLYTVEIKGFSPDITPEKTAALDALFVKKKCLARFTDNNGLIHLAGTPIEHLLFAYEQGTDSAVAGSRGYSLKLTGTLTQRPSYA